VRSFEYRSIDSQGWLDWAERKPGPVEKQYTQRNSAEGYIPHSMVGKLAGWYSRLFDMSREADGRFTANAAASVHGSILLGGHTIQHYSFTASCWASGNRKANTTRIAFENESVYTGGRPDESIPFTEAQLLSNVRIIKELTDWKGWTPARPPSVLAPATLLEHNEAVRIWGGHATACPSNRAEWPKFLHLLNKEEDDMAAVLFTVKLASQETWLVDGKGFYRRVEAPGPLQELRDAEIARGGTSIVLSREALLLMGIPASELP